MKIKYTCTVALTWLMEQLYLVPDRNITTIHIEEKGKEDEKERPDLWLGKAELLVEMVHFWPVMNLVCHDQYYGRSGNFCC